MHLTLSSGFVPWHPREPRGKILSLIPNYEEKYLWEWSLLGLVLQVEIENADIQKN